MGLITHPHIETVTAINYLSTHGYNGILFDNYVVELEGHDEPYWMTKKVVEYNFIPEVNDRISCLIEEGRLKHVKILRECPER